MSTIANCPNICCISSSRSLKLAPHSSQSKHRISTGKSIGPGALIIYPKVHARNNVLVNALKNRGNYCRDLYPEIEPYSSGFLEVSDLHSLYWEQSGNPNGHPVVFLHGGPGAGTDGSCRRFFDPNFFRIVLFDQRGAGKSRPHACLEDNTTWELIKDIEKLRKHLDIDKWQVFGGSWGSTLALAYAQSCAEHVTAMVLRGIFLLRKKEIDWFYEGGAAAIYPDAWEKFRNFIPEEERDNFVIAYAKRLNGDDPQEKKSAAKIWTTWEIMTSCLLPNKENMRRGDDDKFALGRYDICCPMMSAWDLHKAWPEAEFKVISDAGHSAKEPGITAELVAANERFKELQYGDRLPS